MDLLASVACYLDIEGSGIVLAYLIRRKKILVLLSY